MILVLFISICFALKKIHHALTYLDRISLPVNHLFFVSFSLTKSNKSADTPVNPMEK